MKYGKVLLLGAYGQTNLGDDLLLYNYLKFLDEKGFKEIEVNASEAKYIPKSIAESFPNMKVFETYNTSPLALIKRLLQADCVVYGGGTVYKELYATTGRSRYAVIVNVALFNIMARILGKPVYGCHLGIGSIKTGFGRFMSRMALLASKHTTFRDEKSFSYARDVLKLPAKKISHSTDGLFINTEWKKPWNTLAIERPKNARRVVGVNVLHDIPDWVDRKKYIKDMVSFLDRLMKQGDYLVFMPFQTDFNKHNDLVFLQKEILPKLTGKSYRVSEDLVLDNIISGLQQIDILVGMRLHSLELAATAGTPFVALAYDTKCVRYAQEIDHPYVLKLEEFSEDALYNMYSQAIEDDKIKPRLQKVTDTNYKIAGAWLKSLDF